VKRGDIWIVNLDPGFGREIHKKRPALIVSKNLIHQATSNVIIIPISSQVPPTVGPEMMILHKDAGVEKTSVLLPLFIRSIDQVRLVKKIGSLPAKIMIEVEEAIKLVLDLP
jgi:mRNA interferase MazF